MVVVKKEDFDACTEKKVVNIYRNGRTITGLPQAGNYYYYSGVGKHCEAGQKLDPHHCRPGRERARPEILFLLKPIFQTKIKLVIN